ncbi:MAG: PDZ domain-containing protein [Limisphaerales bacterium]
MQRTKFHGAFLFWFLLVLAVVGVGGAVAGWQRAYGLDGEVVRLTGEVGRLEGELEFGRGRVRVVEGLQEEVKRLQRDVQELHRLRGEQQEWRRVKEELAQCREQFAVLQQAQREAAARGVGQPRPEPVSWIGVVMAANPGGGVKVQSVVPGSPAAKVDMVMGDVIISADGRVLGGPTDLREVVGQKKVGEGVSLGVRRGGQVRNLVLTTEAFPR